MRPSLVYYLGMDRPHYTFYTYATVHGPITLRCSERGLVEVVFGSVRLEGRNIAHAITNQAANELQEYLAGKRAGLDLNAYATRDISLG